MKDKHELDRRKFLKQAAGAVGAAVRAKHLAAQTTANQSDGADVQSHPDSESPLRYPRQFLGRQLRMISFPLGGVAAGSIGLGGRGQLDNWEIFNRPNKGFRPSYAFPSIWAQAGGAKPVAHVLEARIQPPYEGPDGLGANNAPGLSRLESATFTGEYPWRISTSKIARCRSRLNLTRFRRSSRTSRTILVCQSPFSAIA